MVWLDGLGHYFLVWEKMKSCSEGLQLSTGVPTAFLLVFS